MNKNPTAGKTKNRIPTCYNREWKGKRNFMKRRLIIDGNAVYEIDENCMLQRRIEKDEQNRQKEKAHPNANKEAK